MAPSKRSRPAFSPPRPHKSNKTSATISNSSTGKTLKTKTRKTPSKVSTSSKSASGINQSKSKGRGSEVSERRRSKLVSPTPSASDSLGEASEEDDKDDDDDDDDNDEEDVDNNRLSNENSPDSFEPDFILAEVTESTASTEPSIPIPLIHRILHSQFSEPETTKISTDARQLVAKYIEVFVREAIMRCAYEKNGDNGDGPETTADLAGGWLELEDLEKVAVQLCLDF